MTFKIANYSNNRSAVIYLILEKMLRFVYLIFFSRINFRKIAQNSRNLRKLVFFKLVVNAKIFLFSFFFLSIQDRIIFVYRNHRCKNIQLIFLPVILHPLFPLEFQRDFLSTFLQEQYFYQIAIPIMGYS